MWSRRESRSTATSRRRPIPDVAAGMRELLTQPRPAACASWSRSGRCTRTAARVFLEAGPGRILTGLVKRILEDEAARRHRPGSGRTDAWLPLGHLLAHDARAGSAGGSRAVVRGPRLGMAGLASYVEACGGGRSRRPTDWWVDPAGRVPPGGCLRLRPDAPRARPPRPSPEVALAGCTRQPGGRCPTPHDLPPDPTVPGCVPAAHVQACRCTQWIELQREQARLNERFLALQERLLEARSRATAGASHSACAAPSLARRARTPPATPVGLPVAPRRYYRPRSERRSPPRPCRPRRPWRQARPRTGMPAEAPAGTGSAGGEPMARRRRSRSSAGSARRGESADRLSRGDARAGPAARVGPGHRLDQGDGDLQRSEALSPDPRRSGPGRRGGPRASSPNCETLRAILDYYQEKRAGAVLPRSPVAAPAVAHPAAAAVVPTALANGPTAPAPSPRSSASCCARVPSEIPAKWTCWVPTCSASRSSRDLLVVATCPNTRPCCGPRWRRGGYPVFQSCIREGRRSAIDRTPHEADLDDPASLASLTEVTRGARRWAD